MSLATLPSELIRSILLQRCISPQDLLRCALANKQLYTLVTSCEEAWKRLFHDTFPLSKVSVPVPCWKEKFKNQYKDDVREKRLNRKVEIIKLNSYIQACENSLKLNTQQTQTERSRQKEVVQELTSINAARRMQAASKLWAPMAIQQHFKHVLQHAPIESTHRQQQLERDLRLSKSRVAALANEHLKLAQKLQDLRRRLAMCQGSCAHGLIPQAHQ